MLNPLNSSSDEEPEVQAPKGGGDDDGKAAAKAAKAAAKAEKAKKKAELKQARKEAMQKAKEAAAAEKENEVSIDLQGSKFDREEKARESSPNNSERNPCTVHHGCNSQMLSNLETTHVYALQ